LGIGPTKAVNTLMIQDGKTVMSGQWISGLQSLFHRHRHGVRHEFDVGHEAMVCMSVTMAGGTNNVTNGAGRSAVSDSYLGLNPGSSER